MTADAVFLTTADMATKYRVPTAAAFLQRFREDEKRPPELREYPDPVNRSRGKGVHLRWSPAVVESHLRGEPLKFAKRRA